MFRMYSLLDHRHAKEKKSGKGSHKLLWRVFLKTSLDRKTRKNINEKEFE